MGIYLDKYDNLTQGRDWVIWHNGRRVWKKGLVAWPFGPRFSPEEFKCKGALSHGAIVIDLEAGLRLADWRDLTDRPFNLRSAYRTPEHNATIPGAAKNSYHMQAIAFDICLEGHDPVKLWQDAKQCGMKGFGYYPSKRKNFLHADIGPEREWGNKAGYMKLGTVTGGKIYPVGVPEPGSTGFLGQFNKAKNKVTGGFGKGQDDCFSKLFASWTS